MLVNSINQYSNISPYQQIMAQNLRINQASKLGYFPAIEPISPISNRQTNPIIDKNDINYDKIKQYEEEVFGRQNRTQDELTLSALPQENNFKQEFEQAINPTNSNNKNVSRETLDKNTNNSKGIANEGNSANSELTEEQQKQVRELERIDREVRAHEQAHLAAGGSLVQGGASYSYTQGPDGKQYATGGEVNIDTSPENTPSKTIAKMQQVIAAAMAPAKPSGQDYSVASAAQKVIAESKIEETRLKQEESRVAIEENENINSSNNNSEDENLNQKITTINTETANINSSNSIQEKSIPKIELSQLSTYENQRTADSIYKQHLGQITNRVA